MTQERNPIREYIEGATPFPDAPSTVASVDSQHVRNAAEEATKPHTRESLISQYHLDTTNPEVVSALDRYDDLCAVARVRTHLRPIGDRMLSPYKRERPE